jgi:hypothetical protein
MQAEERQHQEEKDPIPAQTAVWRIVLLAPGCLFPVGNILIADEMISPHGWLYSFCL